MAVPFHDHLSWDNFVDGRICALWVFLQAEDIHIQGLTRGADLWAPGLMHCLLELTHRQWLYPNARVHMKVKDGMMAAQHNTMCVCEESCPLLCGFTAMLFGLMPSAYEDSVKVKLV
jgi:hypothetical protein